jgi:hypothetical protein
MGDSIVRLLNLFVGRLPDAECHKCVTELAANPSRWSAGHAMFNVIRKDLLIAMDSGNHSSAAQYSFEESCCAAMYNASEPQDPFDSSTPFFVVPQALGLARLLGVHPDEVAAVFTGDV